MTWIRVNSDVIDHPKTDHLAELLGLPRAAAVGLLVGVWGYAAEHHPDGDVTDVKLSALHRRVGWTSAGLAADSPLTCPRNDVREALIASGWADEEDGRIVLHDWHEWNGKLADRRAKDRDRKRLARSERPQDTVRTVRSRRRVSAGHAADSPHTRHDTVRSTPLTPQGGDGASNAPEEPPRASSRSRTRLEELQHEIAAGGAR